VPSALADAAAAALAADAGRSVTVEGEAWFVHPHNPPLRLVIVGAVHIAQALVPMALPLGFAVTVVDPRRAFASEERFGDRVAISTEWPDDAMAALAPDARTAVVTLTHDPKLDDPALDVALRSPAFYIGALGSRRTHAKRVARLAEMGHGEDAVARIHAPVGLDIEAVTAPEIAVSILAEIVAVRRGAKT
jgi:xanthine dehydrogenase accessory factor